MNAPAATPLIEVIALRKSYGTRLAIDDVTFSVAPGQIIGLLGPNGAGKTTTLSIISTLVMPDRGEVRIDGRNAHAERRTVRRRLGFVPQSIALYPSLSGRHNLLLFARLHGLSARDARRTCGTALERVGLADRADQVVATLSGGMKRRLNLACAMVHRPDVILLDEPTVGIDPQSRENILATVRELARTGAAAIYSTHYMEEVERVCDRTVLIDQGRVIGGGTVAELIASAGGRPRLAITFREAAPAGWYAGVAGVREVTPPDAINRTVLEFPNLAQAGELLERARASAREILEFSVHQPNLSDAFMALTGHALRDPTGDE